MIRAKNVGFSLTEVLMAVGILSVGMMLIATMFPVAIYLTTVASERTMAAIVADEAFAKIQLYGIVDPYNDPCVCFDYEDTLGPAEIDPNEFSYPSVDPATGNRQYYWSALYKLINANDTEYLITVFVARKTNPNLIYRSGPVPKPMAVAVEKPAGLENNQLRIKPPNENCINPPTTILWNNSGRLYRIVDRVGNIITLDRPWAEDMSGIIKIFLVIPPPNTGGKNADIEVYQRIMKF